MDNMKKEQMNEEFKEAIRQDKIRTAERELAEFIKKNPQYNEQQEDIQKTLDSTPEDRRLEVIAMLMAGKLAELTEAFCKFNETVINL
jgi:hypothetical protein